MKSIRPPSSSIAVNGLYKVDSYEPSHLVLLPLLPKSTDWSILFTCEHASNRLPHQFRRAWGEEDVKRRLHETHWAYDIAAESFTKELFTHLLQNPPSERNQVQENVRHAQRQLSAVIATYSRLLLDCNRRLGEDTMFRSHCDDQIVSINIELTEEEKQNRINKLYVPYHEAIDQIIENAELPPKMIISMHSFTDNYQGQKREMEIGVLFNAEHTDIGIQIVEELRKMGYKAVDNKPWSALDGLMYSATHHAQKHDVKSLPIMFEVRNDCLSNAEWRKQLVQNIHSILSSSSLLPFCSIY